MIASGFAGARVFYKPPSCDGPPTPPTRSAPVTQGPAPGRVDG
jgi:hypothetical protein